MKITLCLAVSLDGYIARSDGSFDWCMTDQDYGMSALLSRIDSVIMGRRSWELLLEMGEQPDPKKTYYVLTHRAGSSGYANVRFVSGDAVAISLRLHADGRRHAWLFGGGDVCGQFAQAGLIDECMIALHPLALGQGMPLFAGLRRDFKLRLLETIPYPTGLVMLRYAAAAGGAQR